ncbi:peptidase M12B domain-containing protein [Vairimorpha necatrix]|uniref:Peptidase M12B domain-containing protein n=1 Tax=Vairimorpha necatrix TaxID=6039 RepID=A0AAX4JCJ9_9MICR
MNCIILFFLLIRPETLYTNILYERIVDPDMEALYKDIIKSLINKHNEFLKRNGIEIKVQDALSYSMYSQLPDYKELQRYGGTDNLSDRMSVIAEMNKNILLIASSETDQSDVHYNLDNPCITKYITTFNNNDSLSVDTVSAINSAIKRYLSQLLDIHLPKVYGIVNLGELTKFKQKIRHSNFKEKLFACVSKNRMIKKDIDIYSEFDKIKGAIPEEFNILSEPNNYENFDEPEKKVFSENRKTNKSLDYNPEIPNINNTEDEKITRDKNKNINVPFNKMKKKFKKKKKFQNLTRPRSTTNKIEIK